MNKGLVPIVLAGAALAGLAGCQTSRYSEKDMLGVPSEVVKAERSNLRKTVEMTFKTNNRTQLSYENAQDRMRVYSGVVPRGAWQVYFNDGKSAVAESIDSSGPLIPSIGAIRDLEDMMGDDGRAMLLEMGAADRNKMLTSRGGDNQFSNESGLMGVAVYGKGKKPGVIVRAEEVIGVDKRLNDRRTYRIEMAFAEGDVALSKTRVDSSLVDQGILTGVGAAINPAIGGAIAVDYGITDFVALIEGSQMPSKTALYGPSSLAKGNLTMREANVVETMLTAQRLDANQIAVFRYGKNRENAAVVYAKDARDFAATPTGLVFYVDQTGANRLAAGLFGLARVGASTGVGIGIYNCINDHHENGTGVTGGRTGGPGGTSSGGVTGGSNGGVGGTSITGGSNSGVGGN